MSKFFIEDKEALAALTFAMSFGHSPTPAETLQNLEEAGYFLVKVVKDEE
jgi:hypothetical protein